MIRTARDGRGLHVDNVAFTEDESACALAVAGAPAKEVLDFLLNEHGRLSTTEMVAILPYCGQPYSSLATANGGTLTVPHSEPMRGVLQALKTANVVKEFRKKTLREQFDVHMAG